MYRSAGSVVGRIVPAYAADIFGRMKTMVLVCMTTSILLLGFWVPIEIDQHTTHVQIIVFVVMYGFASGAWISLMLPCIADMNKDPKTLGQTFGIYLFITGIGYAVSRTTYPISGKLTAGVGVSLVYRLREP